MATRTIDLAEAQRALAASRLADRLPPLWSTPRVAPEPPDRGPVYGRQRHPRRAFAERTTPSSRR